MKAIYLFIMFVFLYVIPAIGVQKDFGESFVISLQSKYPHTRLKDTERQLLIKNINKRIQIKLKSQTNNFTKTDIENITSQNVSEIIQAIIQTGNEIYKTEADKYKYKINSVENISCFAEKFAKEYTNETSTILISYLNDTNNWKTPAASIISSFLYGIHNYFHNIPGILAKKYLTLYSKLYYAKQIEYKSLPPNYHGEKPVNNLWRAVNIRLEEYSKTAPLPQLEELLQQETNTAIIEVLLFGVRHQPSDKAYEIYKKYYPKTVKYSTKGEIRGMIQAFREECDEYKRWDKWLKAAGYDKKKAETQYKKEIDEIKTKLESFPLNNPSKLPKFIKLLQKAEELNKENPHYGFYVPNYLKPINQNPVTECKEAYWQILQRNPDEKKYEIEPKIALACGEAYGKVMTKEDVSKVIDYMNKQKSFKLIELMGSVLGKEPKVYKKLGSMNIIEGIRFPARKEIIQEFYKNRDKIKDNFIKKGIIEMAKDNGVAK